MLRLVLFSDAHGDARTSGVRRHAEVVEAMRQAFAHAIQVKADYVGFLGDLTDPAGDDSYRTIGELRKLVDWAALKDVGFFALSGNHDVLESGVEPRSVLCALGKDDCVWDRPGATSLCARSERVPVLFLPYTPSWAPYDPAEHARRFVEENPRGKGLVFGHLNLEGIFPGSEAKEFARGREIFWPLDVLEPHADRLTMVGGHIHARQTYRGIRIVGSLARLDHGEEKTTPSFLEIEI